MWRSRGAVRLGACCSDVWTRSVPGTTTRTITSAVAVGTLPAGLSRGRHLCQSLWTNSGPAGGVGRRSRVDIITRWTEGVQQQRQHYYRGGYGWAAAVLRRCYAATGGGRRGKRGVTSKQDRDDNDDDEGGLPSLPPDAFKPTRELGQATIYHYPMSRSSHGAIQLLEAACPQRPRIIDIVAEPLSSNDVVKLMASLGITDPRDFMRVNDPLYKELGLDNPSLSHDDLIKEITKHPRLMKRPVVEMSYREDGKQKRQTLIAQPPQRLFTVILNESEEEALGLAPEPTPKEEESEAERWVREWYEREGEKHPEIEQLRQTVSQNSGSFDFPEETDEMTDAEFNELVADDEASEEEQSDVRVQDDITEDDVKELFTEYEIEEEMEREDENEDEEEDEDEDEDEDPQQSAEGDDEEEEEEEYDPEIEATIRNVIKDMALQSVKDEERARRQRRKAKGLMDDDDDDEDEEERRGEKRDLEKDFEEFLNRIIDAVPVPPPPPPLKRRGHKFHGSAAMLAEPAEPADDTMEDHEAEIPVPDDEGSGSSRATRGRKQRR